MILLSNPPTCVADAPFTEGDIADVLMDASLQVGIDRVRVQFPFTRRIGGVDMWRRMNQDQVNGNFFGEGDFPLGQGEVHLYFNDGYRRYGNIKFNPSTVLFGGSRLATWLETQTVLIDAMEIAFQHFEGNDRLEDLKVTLLDLSVDFHNVLNVDKVLQDFSKFEPIRGRTPLVVPNPYTGALETVTYTSSSEIRVMAYNKSAQRRDGGSTLRFENTLAGKDLSKYGLNSVAASDEDRARGFRARLWPLLARWSGSPSQTRDQILSEPATTKMLVSAAGLEYLDGFGFHPPLTRNFEKRLRQFKRKFRIGAVKDLFA